MICWVQIDQKVGHELIESGYEMSEFGYESSGYERSMGTKRLDTWKIIHCVWFCGLKILIMIGQNTFYTNILNE